MKRMVAILLLLAAGASAAEVPVPVRTIRAREVIAAEDLVLNVLNATGAVSDPADLVGQEARVVLYPGRPIRPGDVGPPAVVGRNDLVVLVYRLGRLSIRTEGRALGRGAAGETVRAMNMASRVTVTGRVTEDGTIEVQ